mgnify:CR=1 FL=1
MSPLRNQPPRVFAAGGHLEGHLGDGLVIAGVGLEPCGGVGDIGGKAGLVPDQAFRAGGLDGIAVFEIRLASHGAADDAEQVRAGLAALLNFGAVIGHDTDGFFVISHNDTVDESTVIRLKSHTIADTKFQHIVMGPHVL